MFSDLQHGPDPGGTPVLAAGRLHEIHAGLEDWAVAMAFALVAALAAPGHGGPLVLVRARACAALPLYPYGTGLAGLGIDPARLLIVEAADDMALLRAGLEAARCPGLAALLVESWGRLPAYDLTASRRLVLAAERSGVPVIMLRLEASPQASAAHSRWLVQSLPSTPLPATPRVASAPGSPAVAAELLRWRGGPAGSVRHLEWNDEDGVFRERATSLSGAVVSLGGERTRARA